MIGKREGIRLRLVMALFAATAQVFIAGAPLAEARFGPDAGAHVEAAGTSLHHAHNEATCAACVSQHLLATSEPGQSAAFVVVASSSPPLGAVPRADSFAQRFFTKSRAPPSATV